MAPSVLPFSYPKPLHYHSSLTVRLQVTSNRASTRVSTYSSFAASPTFSPSHSRVTHYPSSSSPSTTTLESQGLSEIRHLTAGLDRLENKHLQQQRFVPSAQKSDDLSKLALGAKVERALGRRMTDQDAVFKVKVKSMSEKGNSLGKPVGAKVKV